MSTNRYLLIFDFDGVLFGVPAELVRETVWLPELAPVEEAPGWVVGLFSLRGQITPVTDLGLRFRHTPRDYLTSDQVVVLELDHRRMGLMVSEVREVIEISTSDVQSPPQFDEKTSLPEHLVEGLVRVGADIVALLDAGQLVRPWDECALGGNEPAPATHFCPQATPQERSLFRQRASTLMEPPVEQEAAGLGLAVVEIDGEYFGIELEAVREFCNITELAPIPCCPRHVLGAMSLRGTIFIVIDVRAALNLAPSRRPPDKVVVGSLGGQPVGVAVDAVHDVVYPREGELQAAPLQLRERHGAEIKGAAPWNGKIMAVLDLPALLAREEWVVNEQP